MGTLPEVWRIALRVLGYLSIALVVASVVLMVRSLHRERRLKAWPLVLPLAFTPLILLLYVLLLRVTVHTALSWLLLAGGLVLGVVWSRSTRMRVKKSQVYARRSVWYLVIWAATFVYTQTVVVLGAGTSMASYGLATIYFSTGLAVGSNFGLLVSRAATLARTGGAPARTRPLATAGGAATGRAAAAAGGSAPAAAQPAVAGTAAPPPAAAAACPGCGQPVDAGFSFCGACGRPLDSASS